MYMHICACVYLLSTTYSSSFTMQSLPVNARLKLIKFIFIFSFKHTALGFLCFFLGARSIRTVSHSAAQADNELTRLLIHFPGARITGESHYAFFPPPMLGLKPRAWHMWGKFYHRSTSPGLTLCFLMYC